MSKVKEHMVPGDYVPHIASNKAVERAVAASTAVWDSWPSPIDLSNVAAVRNAAMMAALATLEVKLDTAVAVALPGIDSQVMVAASEGRPHYREQPVWLWYCDDTMELSLGRWNTHPKQAPYGRLDIAADTIASLTERLSVSAAKVAKLESRCLDAINLTSMKFVDDASSAVVAAREKIRRVFDAASQEQGE